LKRFPERIETTVATIEAATTHHSEAYQFIPGFCCVCLAQSLVFCVLFVVHCWSFLVFFLLYCVFFDLRLLITPFISANFVSSSMYSILTGQLHTNAE
jgi:hypothetical protein